MQINSHKLLKITERILLILEYKGITKYKFHKDLGLSNGFLDKGREIGTTKYAKILEYIPDVNPNWLLTGEGDMLKSGHEVVAKKEGVSVAAPDDSAIKLLKEQLKEKEIENKEYVKQITKLEMKVEELEKEITFLKKANPQVTYSINSEP